MEVNRIMDNPTSVSGMHVSDSSPLRNQNYRLNSSNYCASSLVPGATDVYLTVRTGIDR